MELFVSTTSPFARKVLMLVREKGALDRVDLKVVDPWKTPPELVNLNPLSKVPTLVLDNHRVIIESDVICEYLDQHLPGPRLIPESGDAYWHTRVLEALAGGVLEASVDIHLQRQRCPEERRCKEWIDYQRRAIGRTLDTLEDQMDRLAGDFDYAAICVVAALGHLEFRDTYPEWREVWPRLADWFDSLQSRPSVEATQPRLPAA